MAAEAAAQPRMVAPKVAGSLREMDQLGVRMGEMTNLGIMTGDNGSAEMDQITDVLVAGTTQEVVIDMYTLV